MTWVGFFKESHEVVHGRPRLMLVTACGGWDVPHARAARLHVVTIIVVDHGHDPLKALLAHFFAALDALPAIVDGDIRRCSIAAARGHFLASMSRVKHDCLIDGGVLGGDAARHLECVPEKVTTLTLERAPCAELGPRAHDPLASLTPGLWFDASALPPWWGPG
jgi:hypothetical protein